MRHTDAEGGDGVFRGITDMDLTPHGVEHAKMFAKKLRNLHIDRIYASRLQRAIHTAEPIAKMHNLKINKSVKINEINFGVFDGMQVDDVKKKYKDLYEARGRDMHNFRLPGGGESYEDVCKRALPFILHEAGKYPGQTLLFVTHGSLIRSILLKVMKTTHEHLRSQISYGCRVFLKHNKSKLSFQRIEP